MRAGLRLKFWWWKATHVPCPVCQQPISLGRGWREHKLRHDPDLWRDCILGNRRDW